MMPGHTSTVTVVNAKLVMRLSRAHKSIHVIKSAHQLFSREYRVYRDRGTVAGISKAQSHQDVFYSRNTSQPHLHTETPPRFPETALSPLFEMPPAGDGVLVKEEFEAAQTALAEALGEDCTTGGINLRTTNSRNPRHFDGIEGRGKFLTHSKIHDELPKTRS